jgi:heme O synthase-like polyprenyltransferase
MYLDDYARAGIRMLPVIEPDGKSTTWHIVAFASTLIPVSLFPVLLGMTGQIYFVVPRFLVDASSITEFVLRWNVQTSGRDRFSSRR